jgi:hypothetical protein
MAALEPFAPNRGAEGHPWPLMSAIAIPCIGARTTRLPTRRRTSGSAAEANRAEPYASDSVIEDSTPSAIHGRRGHPVRRSRCILQRLTAQPWGEPGITGQLEAVRWGSKPRGRARPSFATLIAGARTALGRDQVRAGGVLAGGYPSAHGDAGAAVENGSSRRRGQSAFIV